MTAQKTWLDVLQKIDMKLKWQVNQVFNIFFCLVTNWQLKNNVWIKNSALLFNNLIRFFYEQKSFWLPETVGGNSLLSKKWQFPKKYGEEMETWIHKDPLDSNHTGAVELVLGSAF